MGYGDSPSAKAGPTRSKAKKKPCKYGARTKDGLCPKKPKSAAKKRPCKYGRGDDGYCNKKPSSGSYYDRNSDPTEPKPRRSETIKITPRRGAGTAEKVATKVVEQAAQSTLRRLAQKAQKNPEQASAAGGAAAALARTSVKKALATGAGRMALGSVALAGIAAYAATTYIIKKVARNKEEKQQQAYEAALAYREARAAARRVVNRDLTPAENRSLGAEFKATLRKLGIAQG